MSLSFMIVFGLLVDPSRIKVVFVRRPGAGQYSVGVDFGEVGEVRSVIVKSEEFLGTSIGY